MSTSDTKQCDSILDLTYAIKQGACSSVNMVQTSFDQIEKLDNHLHCFHETYSQQALEQAKRIDQRIAAKENPGPLAGIPIALKDNIVTDFGHTTCGSRMLENFQSPYSSTVAERLINAGAIIVGKTNCDEFAMGSSTEHCAWGVTRNPWDTTRTPGGSSGGSAAAVASGMVPAALGSDTGGSIRQPAALCGVVGLKPSYGRVSRYGLVAFGSSLDQIGPLTTSVSDAAAILQVIAGHDHRDSTCADRHIPDYQAKIDEPIEDLRIGVPKQYLSKSNHPAVNETVRNAIKVYEQLGATIIDIDLPLTKYGIATYYIIAPAEASSNLARYDGIRYGHRAKLEPGETLNDLYAKSRSEGFGEEVQRRIMLGTYVLSAGYYDAYYKRALQVRRLIKQEFDQAFEQCHVLLGPTSPFPAFPIGDKTDPMQMYQCDAYTVNANIAGICAISIPGGFARENEKDLPIGIQLQGKAFDEATLLRAARMFEMNTDFHTREPTRPRVE